MVFTIYLLYSVVCMGNVCMYVGILPHTTLRYTFAVLPIFSQQITTETRALVTGTKVGTPSIVHNALICSDECTHVHRMVCQSPTRWLERNTKLSTVLNVLYVLCILFTFKLLYYIRGLCLHHDDRLTFEDACPSILIQRISMTTGTNEASR